jgi:ribosomal protein L37E
MTHRQYDSCFLRALVPSREKNISCKDARTQRDQRKPCSSKKTIQGYAAPSNTHVPMTHNQRDSCSLCGFAPSREKNISRKDARTQRDQRKPRSSKKTIQGYAALSNTHVPITHNQRDSCSLCGFAPSREKKHLTQRRQDAKRPKEATLQQKTIQGYAAPSNTHVPMTHNQRDSCSLRALVPSREKNISPKEARTKREQRKPCSSKKQFRGMQL